MASAPHGGWRTSRLPELVGAKEALEILGVQKMTLNRWLREGSGNEQSCHGEKKTYMLTPQHIAAGPVWARSDVEHFAEMIGRRRAPVAV